ncbi:uncharacterized protein COLE_00017 [Cutaneotrichosporon oleaginosum]|uniref:uncharacterized protein n=1 Tax=Cutaneotrichosporon oleaginosum TaxID=879819 RepID=UPI0013263800|nr:hypothetical protein COLE_00017 [Cutaneotrichosporon oleaginosum]
MLSYTTQSSTTIPPTKLSAVAPGTKLDSDALIVPVSTGDNGVQLGDAHGLKGDRASSLSAQLARLGFKGKAGSITSLPGVEGDPAPVLIFAGLGKPEKDGSIKSETLRRTVGAAIRAASGMELASVAIAVPDSAELLTAAAEGASLGAYAWNSYKSKDTSAPVAVIQLVSSASDAAETVRRAEIAARHAKGARNLVNTPPCDLYPETFAQRAIELASNLDGVTVEVWDEKRLAEENCGGLVGVGQGSSKPPRLVKVAYTPNGMTNPKHLSIVGKGVTFDSGGISLKPSAKMHEMKGDMGGAAATLHAVLAAAELQVPARVTGWLCLAENMPSGTALKNGDVIRQRTGTTVEIHNTDAEGRLVLADGLAVAQSKETGYGTEDADPDLLINVATLTGAQLVALGMRTAGLMGDDKAVKAVQAAAAVTGEQFWAMPFPDEMLEDLKSTTADLKNIGGIPMGGMLKAGVFLQQFAGDKGNWAHLDIAGPAANFGSPWGYTPTEGTGFAVRTLVKVAEQLAA